jgi:hypothetical protein
MSPGGLLSAGTGDWPAVGAVPEFPVDPWVVALGAAAGVDDPDDPQAASSAINPIAVDATVAAPLRRRSLRAFGHGRSRRWVR